MFYPLEGWGLLHHKFYLSAGHKSPEEPLARAIESARRAPVASTVDPDTVRETPTMSGVPICSLFSAWEASTNEIFPLRVFKVSIVPLVSVSIPETT